MQINLSINMWIFVDYSLAVFCTRTYSIVRFLSLALFLFVWIFLNTRTVFSRFSQCVDEHVSKTTETLDLR